jgi:hypothetical protein
MLVQCIVVREAVDEGRASRNRAGKLTLIEIREIFFC